jgi:hypothetical protein
MVPFTINKEERYSEIGGSQSADVKISVKHPLRVNFDYTIVGISENIEVTDLCTG